MSYFKNKRKNFLKERNKDSECTSLASNRLRLQPWGNWRLVHKKTVCKAYIQVLFSDEETRPRLVEFTQPVFVMQSPL